MVSGSSLSLPISYYDQTSPYSDFRHDEEDEDDLDDFGTRNLPDDHDLIDVQDVVQAFNPYVKVNIHNDCWLLFTWDLRLVFIL